MMGKGGGGFFALKYQDTVNTYRTIVVVGRMLVKKAQNMGEI
jgi:hypothetical protein